MKVFSAMNCAEDIAMVRGMGLDVDNDNEPSPENIPEEVSEQNRTTVERNCTHEEIGSGWSGIYHQKSLNIQDQKPTIKGFVGESVILTSPLLVCFSFYFPGNLLKMSLL